MRLPSHIMWPFLTVATLAQLVPITAGAQAVEPAGEWRDGPEALKLPNEVQLSLPKGYAFLPLPAAAKFLEKNGVFHNEDLLGVIASGADENAQWLVVLRFQEEGYVKDDQAPNAKELIESFEESLPDLNKEREEKGFAALVLKGWHEEPHYDRVSHHLIWALNVSSKEQDSIVYSTRVLGRRGTLAMNLVTAPELLTQDQVHAGVLLKNISFASGSTYADFKSGDKVAEYGLAGLVLGGAGLGAAVKLGLFAKFSKILIALLLAGKKLVIFVVAALAALFRRFFRRGDVKAVSATETLATEDDVQK